MGLQSFDNLYGVAAATGNNVVMKRSVLSDNSTAGVEADSGATVTVDNSEHRQGAHQLWQQQDFRQHG